MTPLFFKMSDQVQKGPLPLTEHHHIQFREVGEQMLPEKSRADPSEDNLDLGIELLSRASNLDRASAVPMKHGKPDHIRFLLNQRFLELFRSSLDLVPVQEFDIIMVLLQNGCHRIKAHGHCLDVLVMHSLFDEIRIDEQDLHGASSSTEPWKMSKLKVQDPLSRLSP